MERFRGHFFNWYSTRTLAPLHPRYVSMVDSGNLAANLLVLRSGCMELAEAHVLPPRVFGGLRDTLWNLLDAARGVERSLVSADVLRQIERQIESLHQSPSTLSAANALLSRLTAEAVELRSATDKHAELAWWADAYERCCKDHRADLLQLAGWIDLAAPPERLVPARQASNGRNCARRLFVWTAAPRSVTWLA
jgi:hypothetical protein